MINTVSSESWIVRVTYAHLVNEDVLLECLRYAGVTKFHNYNSTTFDALPPKGISPSLHKMWAEDTASRMKKQGLINAEAIRINV